MTNSEQDRWSRVKGRLRTSVGEDVYTSWFARMDLEGVQDDALDQVAEREVLQLRETLLVILFGRERVSDGLALIVHAGAPARHRPQVSRWVAFKYYQPPCWVP